MGEELAPGMLPTPCKALGSLVHGLGRAEDQRGCVMPTASKLTILGAWGG